MEGERERESTRVSGIVIRTCCESQLSHFFVAPEIEVLRCTLPNSGKTKLVGRPVGVSFLSPTQ